MKNTNRRNRTAVIVTPEEKQQYIWEIEKENPGFINENEKLTALVRIMTGIRIMYGFFYTYMAYMFGLPVSQGIVVIVSSVFFFLWYSWMLRSGKLIAVMMLAFRGVGIAMGGASLLPMAPWLPLSLIFTLTFSIIMEFGEAVFCIYVLFYGPAAETVRLNRLMDEGLLKRRASRKMMEALSEYRNDSQNDDDESQEAEVGKTKEKETEEQNT